MSRQPPAIQPSQRAASHDHPAVVPAGSRSSFWLTAAIVVALVILIQLARLLSPQFGLLDDGYNIETARRITSGQWDMSFDFQAGRFRPLYWLYYAGMYALAGPSPFWFYFFHTLLFAALALLLVVLLRQAGASALQIRLTGILFVLCSPAIENFYTLSKGEPLQLALILLALVVVHPVATKAGGERAARMIFAALLLALSMATKETTLAIVPIATGWLGVGWLASHRSRINGGIILRTAPAAALLAAGVAAVLIFALGRALALGSALSTGTYANDYQISLGGIAAQAVRWAGWLLRGFPYALPLALLVVYRLIRRPALVWSPFLSNSLIWMLGWIAVFLPWPFAQEYYMLAFGLGLVVLCGWAAAQSVLMAREAGPTGRAVIVLGLAAAVLLWAGTLLNNYTNARIQLAVDRANTEMVNFLAETLPPGQHVLLNIQSANEYTNQLALTLHDLKQRTDITLETYQRQAIPAGDVVIMPAIENQPRLVVRMGVAEPVQKAWNEDLQSTLATGQTVITYQNNQQFQLLNLDYPRLLCPLLRRLDYCQVVSPLLDRSIFTYGWTVYQVQTVIQKP